MAYPQVAYSNAATQASSTSHALGLSGSAAAGSLLIVGFLNDTSTLNAPGGWSTFGSSSAGWGSRTWKYKTAAGSDTDTWTTVGATTSVHYVYEITGWDSGTPPTMGPQSASTGASGDPIIHTPSWGIANNLWILSGFLDDGDDVMTDWEDFGSNQVEGSISGTGGGTVFAGTQNKAIGALDPGVVTWTSSTSYGLSVIAVSGTGSPYSVVVTASPDDA